MNERDQLDLRDKIVRLKSALLVNPGKKIHGEDALPLAAVCVILRPETGRDDLSVMMIKRKDLDWDPWSGHMAFPGGHYAETDQDLVSTVIREVLEETNVDLRYCTMLGTLDEMLPGNRQIKVTPFVALAPENIEVKINEGEVAKSFWIPLSFFSDSRNQSTHSIERSGAKFNFPCFVFSGQYIIWGMSYRIIHDFLSKTSGLH